jgi:hypothetical protein
MESERGPEWPDQSAVALRARYRCTMCHKNCQTPCRFTAAEFRLLEQGSREGVPPEADPPE